MAYEDTDKLEIPITKVQWGLRGAQVFFAFLSMCCIAAVIAFDNKVMYITPIVGIPFVYLKYGKFKSMARALRVVRIEFVLTAIWCVILTLMSMALSIEVGLRNCDPSSESFNNYTSGPDNSTFVNGLPSTCRTERAGNAFGWFAVGAWLVSLGLLAHEWYSNRRQPLPKHDAEVTMHTNSTRSSLEVPVTEVQYNSHHQEPVMQNIIPQPEQSAYVDYPQPQQPEYQHPGMPPPPQHGSPAIYPAGMPIPLQQQQPSGGSGPGGVNFPQPHHYQQ
ncbi:16454_t:CDS:2 [Acaulospora morrowiae]|uniref:16454_t:CDS:1 n=1 Tax=Acaulospora morrowiae TaxID=94023 RepID=A0A9N9AKF0_9GLOM|nr:16454_t:CDS:2 [Acaulospora morrowiae]